MLTAVCDACVLYPAPPRDLIVRLGGAGMFRARWTNDIHEEWIRNVLKDRADISRGQLERTRDMMNAHILDSLITGYEDVMAAIELPDVDDRHVVAAAIRGHAEIIVTFNLRDSPSSALSRYGIEAQHPDLFLTRLFDVDPACMRETIRGQRLDLKRPPKTSVELLDTFANQSLPLLVDRLRPFIDSL